MTAVGRCAIATLAVVVLVVGVWVEPGGASFTTAPEYVYDPSASVAPTPRERPAGAAARRGYDPFVNLARTNARLDSAGSAPQTVARAESAADAARMTRQLQFDEAASVFTDAGGLHPSVINNSTPIIRGPQLGNQQVVKALTADGSNIADWAKYTTQSIQSPSGPFQVHFYRNSVTGAVNYTHDYKVVFNGAR